MPEESTPPPVFPQYEPPNPDAKPFVNQKPLMKILVRRLHPKPKTRVSPVKKRLAKRKKDGVGFRQ